jgi:integrase
MALMATPWKHPTTGVYYLRRQIPGKMRPAFGGKALFKVSLGTKNAAEANVLFLQANAALEQQFEEIRVRIKSTGEPLPSQRDRAGNMIAAYFQGPERAAGGLNGTERLLLARLEIDRGLWNMTPTGCSPVAASDVEQWWTLSNNAAMFRDHGGTRRPPQGHSPGSIWRWNDDAFRPEAKAKQIERLLEQVARYNAMERHDLPAAIADVAAAYLNSTPVEVPNTRKRRTAAGRLRPDLRLMELFDCWKLVMQPTLQTAHEYEGAARDFVDFLGDIPVENIEQNDLLDYRDEARHLPATMPKADRALSFTERLDRHRHSEAARIAPPTLKKRIGGVQALLSFAKGQKWITRNEGHDVPVVGYTKGGTVSRQTFQEDELRLLFTSRLFTAPRLWKQNRAAGDMTLYWLFLLGLTTGARLEEIGQAMLADVKTSDAITYIDIDDYEAADDEDKSIKTSASRRLVPIHSNLFRLGFGHYLKALIEAGHTRLFPELVSNQFGKRTKEASRIANRIIDRHVSRDARLVFHSFRHGFKDLALEAGILERIVDQICGHAPTTVGGKYGQGVRLTVLNRELHRLDWSFLDWERLAVASKEVEWETLVAAIDPDPHSRS